MFRRRTRSHSRESGMSAVSSNHEDELVYIDEPEIVPAPMITDPQDPIRDLPDMEGRDSSPDQAYDPRLLFTQGHPLGNILLKMTADLTKLAEVARLRDMSTNVNELCKAFHSGTRLERAKMKNSIVMNNDELEHRILSKELQAHRIETDVRCPTNFSSVPAIRDNPHKLNEVSKVFPRSQCFSGIHKEGQMSVSEFLNNLTGAQEQCNLSEQEFLTRMLYSSTGLAHDLISMWINNKCSAERIYTSLLIHFDKRPSPEDAKMKLYAYRASKNEDLAKVEGRIELLVGTAAKAVPAGASRVAYMDLEGCQALIRALPEWSSIQVSNLYKQLSAKLGRNLTFIELDQALHALRKNIDLDIAQNGLEVHRPNKFSPQKFSPGTNNNNKFSSYAVSNVDTLANRTFPVQKSRTETSFTPQIPSRPSGGMVRRQNNKPQKFANYSRMNTHVASNKPTGGGAFNKFNTKPTRRQDRSNSRNRGDNTRQRFKSNSGKSGNKSSNDIKRCVLCGMTNHRSDTCRMIRDDQGNIKSIIPGYGKCSKCPQRIQPRLHHPENLCPFRHNGPMADRSNN